MNEMPGDDRRFPPALAEVAAVEFDFGDDGEGVDFEPYAAFGSADETTDRLRHWTGNHDLVMYDHEPRPDAALTARAERRATAPRRPAQQIIEEAAAAFPTFSADLDALCR